MQKLLLLTAGLFSLASAQETPFPKDSQAYQTIVEAAAKLLEFDIIREDLNRKQAAVLADIHQLQLTTGGSSVRALQYLEGMVQGYDEVIPVFLELQDQLKADASNPAQAAALHGLVNLLATPEVFHMVMPEPKYINDDYRSAMKYVPVVQFIKCIKGIALAGVKCACDEDIVLSESALLFYGIVRQAAAHVFKIAQTDQVRHVAVEETCKHAHSVNEKSLVFIRFHEVCGDRNTPIIEFAKIEKQRDGASGVRAEELIKRRTALCDRFMELATEIAKSYGAITVIDISRNVGGRYINRDYPYVDDAYDITDQVVARMNEEFLQSNGGDSNISLSSAQGAESIEAKSRLSIRERVVEMPQASKENTGCPVVFYDLYRYSRKDQAKSYGLGENEDNEVLKRIHKSTAEVAAERGSAMGLLRVDGLGDNHVYVDPKCDITDEVKKRMDKLYHATEHLKK